MRGRAIDGEDVYSLFFIYVISRLSNRRNT